ncbi:hypothetical protein PCC7424_5003 [Gloeothece citriformis PCC 7424]|uniref:PEP-CTERM protein-sorting domain-containing protein n=1 Tax=Gloeothece citriformis (strain PCC 7424) TaxID=65393 RepID=B7KFN1_GLOC7|nr:hypothetical protein [Gloeothece citriformis]ACK73356.1 hypothetical protein PCC7424_5003 [Gloeothece citriformis PCC 7424]
MLTKLLTTSVYSLGLGLVLQAPVLSASVGFFSNPLYSGTITSNNITNILTDFGHTVNQFDSLEASDWEQAIAENQLLLFDVIGDPIEPDFSEETKTVIRNYVAGGGGVIFTTTGDDNFTLWNSIFNTEIESEIEVGEIFLNTTNAAGTIFADAPPVLQPSVVEGAFIPSLPPGARSIYDNDNQYNASSVFISSFGQGNLVYIGFGFFDLSEDPLWGDVLNLAVDYVAVPEPSLLGAAVMISLGGGFLKTKTKNKNNDEN